MLIEELSPSHCFFGRVCVFIFLLLMMVVGRPNPLWVVVPLAVGHGL